jgi:hypothetical protein
MERHFQFSTRRAMLATMFLVVSCGIATNGKLLLDASGIWGIPGGVTFYILTLGYAARSVGRPSGSNWMGIFGRSLSTAALFIWITQFVRLG